MNDQNGKYTRLRYAATGALTALAAAGAIAGTTALAATRHARQHHHHHAAAANSGATKTPTSPVPDKTDAPRPPVNHQPFLNAIEQLVDNGTITATQARTVDREIEAGRVDTDTLAARGFTQSQLQAVQQALSNAKQARLPRPLPQK